MSAVKLIFKRSSVLGKRPTGANLEAGEIGLNTNSNDPGLFFEVNDDTVVKVGPTSYLPEAPTSAPALGELWVDSDTKALSIGNNDNEWQKVAAPYLGGTNGLTVFVAPEYKNATDSLANDGQTVPFITINRAILEVSKYIIQDTLNGISPGNNRYLIMLAPGQHCVVNRPGISASNFNLDLSSNFTEVTQDILSEFNPENVGGLILPRGVSIIGLDLKKCEIHPTYVPKYTHPAFPSPYQQVTGGPTYANEPISSIFRWTGNTYLSNWVGLDKLEKRTVVSVSEQENTGYALFESARPHGLDYNDFVQVTYSDGADQAGATFGSGPYYVYPVTTYKFLVSPTSWDSTAPAPVVPADLPASYFSASDTPDPKFTVSNIYPYYVPEDGESYELSSYSHHRLSVIKNASLQQLNNFYIKVQKAFPNLFSGQVSTNLASPPEYDIVSVAASEYPNNLVANSTDNSSPYQNTVNHRSDYGMANGDYDGDLVNGFKSVIINSSTAVILQKDPVAYELYSTASQDWIQLTEFTLQSSTTTNSITSVPRNAQLQNLNNAAIPNIRYYYTTLSVTDPADGQPKSTGLPDPDNDFRHFGFRMIGRNAFMQAQSTYTIGAAIACWAKGGARISLTNATTNFGSVGFQAEGFAGIGTLGGANEVNKGFLQAGVVRPLQLLEESVVSDEQKRVLYLGSKVILVALDPNDSTVQNIYLQRPFDPAAILPFSLKPGSAVFVTDGVCTFRAFFVTDGSPTCILAAPNNNDGRPVGGAVLRVRVSDSTIPAGISTNLDIPYIRRYVDPRTDTEKAYGFYIQSTNPTSQAPQLGSVLRLNQTGQTLSNTIKRNYQFDPGQYGGISQVFTVDLVQTEQYSASANFNYKVADAAQASSYVVYSSVTDSSTPWVQSVPQDPTNLDSNLVPFSSPQGSYITFDNKNYYAAENNLWSSLYYNTTFNPLNGPTKVSPDKSDSPFVITTVIEKNELVSDSWQGYVPDQYYDYYVNGIPEEYSANLSYLRGAVIPYSEFGVQFQIDDDDSSNDLGIIFKREIIQTSSTVLVDDSRVVQSAQALTSPYVVAPTFGRPEVLELKLLSTQLIVPPKEGVSVLYLEDSANEVAEFVRVISLTSNVAQVIRNYYPQYSRGTLPAVWPKGTQIKVCEATKIPEPSVYDPDWSVTKSAMFRFYQLMGFSPASIADKLVPQYSGDRLLLNTDLQLSPINGYANLTASWPVEFNEPSAIYANTHTWQYAGFFDYSRGLPKYQVNQIPRKLSYDYQCTTSWGGRLTVTGANEEGSLVFGGPIREALTSQFYVTETPLSYAADRQIYQSPEPVDYPSPILVYSTDDISGDFDGTKRSFPLERGGFPIPTSQLVTNSLFVFIGGIAQIPGEAYFLQGQGTVLSAPQIVFTEAPPVGASCDIRVVTSEDNSNTLEVVSYILSPNFNGTDVVFDFQPTNSQPDNLDSFIFLGGIEQNPAGVNQTSASYDIQYSDGDGSVIFIGGAPDAGTTLDFRAILSGERYRNAGVSTVFVSSVDDIAPLFDNTQRNFALEIDGESLDATKVNSQNIFVSLGGTMQIPVSQSGSPLAGLAYTVQVNQITGGLEITFAEPPLIGTTCNIRVVTSDEFLTCPLPASLTNTSLQDGPGVQVNFGNQIVGIDPGEID